MDLYDVMRTTHAVREFTDEPLPDDTLYRILDNARFAPSGGNRQGTHITVVRDAQTRQRLAELGIPAARRYIAQLMAGENPWNRYIPVAWRPKPWTTPTRRTASLPRSSKPQSCWSSRLNWKSWRPSTKTWTASAWSAGRRSIPLCGTYLWPPAMKVTAATSRPWPSPRRRRCDSCSATRQLTKLRRQTVEETVTHN